MRMKWYYKVLTALIGLIIIALISVDYVVTRIVDESIRRIQLELQDRYLFDYKNINVSLLNKNIVLKDFTFTTIGDTSVINHKFDFSLKKLHLKIDNYREAISNGKLNIRIAELKNPSIIYGLRREMNKEEVNESSFEEGPSLQDRLSSDTLIDAYVSSIFINELRVRNGKLDIYHLDDPHKKLFHSENVSILGDQFKVDFYGAKLDDVISANELILNLQSIRSDELTKHVLNVKDIQFTYSLNELLITGFSFKNSDTPELYSSKQKYRSPWLDIYTDTLRINANPWHIYNKGVLYIKEINIIGADVSIYNDVTLALKPIHQPMPSRAIRNIATPLKIDRINLRNSTLKYRHKTEAENTGLFELDELNLSAQNITNIDYLIDSNPTLKIDVNALLWNSGALTADISIDLKNQIDYVYVKGSVLNLPLQKAENMIKPLYGVSIESGYLNKLSYDLAMNENTGEGRLVFNYSDLKVDIKKDSLKHSDLDGNQKSNKFLNFVANEAIRSNNMPATKKYAAYGHMIFDRTKNKPIFDLYWHSLQTGIMDIVVHDALYTSKGAYLKQEKKKEKEFKAQEKKVKKNK